VIWYTREEQNLYTVHSNINIKWSYRAGFNGEEAKTHHSKRG